MQQPLRANGLRFVNLLTVALNTLSASPAELQELCANLNGLLAKVVGVLNASSLTLPAGTVDALDTALQTLSLST